MEFEAGAFGKRCASSAYLQGSCWARSLSGRRTELNAVSKQRQRVGRYMAGGHMARGPVKVEKGGKSHNK